MKNKSSLAIGTFILLSIIFLSFGYIQPVHSASSWSEPYLLNDEDGITPFIMADPSGVVHVFWGSQGLGEKRGAIFYRRLVDGVWSRIVDIIAPPSGDVAINPSAVIDAAGYIHLVWVSDQLYYSTAHISQAMHPRGWSTPYQMTNYPVVNGVIKIGVDGNLNVLFGSMGTNPAVYLLRSEDGGNTWRIAIQVSTPPRGIYSTRCSLVIDGLGRLHAAWGESILDYPPSGVYYALSEDGGDTWSFPLAIALGEFGEPTLGIDGDGNIHLVWAGTAAWGGKYHSWYDERTGAWSDIEQMFSGGAVFHGSYGMATDSVGRMYLAIPVSSANLFPISSQGEIMVTNWFQKHWEEAYQVSESIMSTDHVHSYSSLTINRGNEIHLVWSMQNLLVESGTGFQFYIWYATMNVDAPEIEAIPISEMTEIGNQIKLLATEQVDMINPTNIAISQENFPSDLSNNQSVPLSIGIISSALILITVMVIGLWRHNR